MAGLATSLVDKPDLCIFLGNLQNLDDLPVPDLIIADLSDSETVRALPALCSHPGIPLLSVNAATSTLTIISGESHDINSIQELISLISKILG